MAVLCVCDYPPEGEMRCLVLHGILQCFFFAYLKVLRGILENSFCFGQNFWIVSVSAEDRNCIQQGVFSDKFLPLLRMFAFMSK